MSARLLLNSERFTLPLHALSVSDANVRKVSPSYIENLAASILADGIIQNLVVIPSKKKKGAVITHEVVAGKRRYLALMFLVGEGHITLDYGVPVLIKERNQATVVSLIENFHREPMHPIDEYKSFAALTNEGLSVAEIALRLGVSHSFVRQRMALGSASPELLDEALQDRMTLEQMKIMCQVESHEKQNEIWFSTPDNWQRNPHNLRERIRGDVFKLSHKLVTFVGLECYQEAGGGINSDLFDDRESSIAAPELLQSLALAKLTSLADALGWSWCEVSLEINHDRIREFSRISPAARDMTEQEAAERALMDDRIAELEDILWSTQEDDGEDYSDDEAVADGSADSDGSLQDEYDALCTALGNFDAQLLEWGDAKNICGVYASVNGNGQPSFVEGLLRKQDARAAASGDTDVFAEVIETPEKGMSGSLKDYLACVRTNVMQAEIIKNPHIGVVLLCHSLVLDVFYKSWSSYKFLDISHVSHSYSLDKHSLKNLSSQCCVAEVRDKWQARLPDEAGLLDFLLALDSVEHDELLAFCSSYALKLHYAVDDANSRYCILGRLLGTDVSSYWRPTAVNFFDRLSKSLIFDALTGAGIVIPPGLSEKMKKSELAGWAEDLIKQNPTWLPEVLSK